MKLYRNTPAHHEQTKPPYFTEKDVNRLLREIDGPYKKGHDNMVRHYKFLLEYARGQIQWTHMTPSQKRYLWAIKAITRALK